MNFKGFISEHEHLRTIKLLYRVRENFGIDTYMSLKKILIIGIIIEHYQNVYRRGPWIRYSTLLERYEARLSLIDANPTHFKLPNDSALYGFSGNNVNKFNLSQVETMTIERCETEFNKSD